MLNSSLKGNSKSDPGRRQESSFMVQDFTLDIICRKNTDATEMHNLMLM